MPNKVVAELISAKLSSGLTCPADPEFNPKETDIVLPAFRTAGMPDEVVKQVGVMSSMLGRAIVHLIESSNFEIVDRAEIVRLRNLEAAAGGQRSRVVPVHCRCDRERRDPLLVLTATDDPVVVIDGRQLIRGLAGRTSECPHRRKS